MLQVVSVFRTSQGTVATRSRCGGTFYYRFAGNSPPRVPVNEEF